MDWFILIFLVPLILVPIVLLCGFAGCGLDLKATGDLPVPAPLAPSNLSATAAGTRLIKLKWDDNSGGTAKFRIERATWGGSFSQVAEVVAEVKDKIITFEDQTPGLVEGTTFLYRVRATVGSVVSDASNVATATTLPVAPTNLVATDVDDNRIDLKWDDIPSKADSFILEHRLITTPPTPTGPFIPIPTGGLTSFSHTGLTGGSKHEYRVIAVVNGYDNSIPKEVRSAPSVIVSATTWKTAYKISLDSSNPLAEDEGDYKDACVVQRISADRLDDGAIGTMLRVTVRAATGNIIIDNLIIDNATISQPASITGSNLWDSAPLPAALAQLLFNNGNPQVSVTAGTPVTSDPVIYALDPSKDLLIAFNIGAQGLGRRTTVTGPRFFFRNNTDQADVRDRLPNYTAKTNMVYFIEKIEVI